MNRFLQPFVDVAKDFADALSRFLNADTIASAVQGIRLSDESQQEEDDKYKYKYKYKEIAEKTIEQIKDSGYFKDEFIPVLSEKIRASTQDGGYPNVFNKEDCLTLEEKRALGLNTRRKYPRELINNLTPKGLESENPNALIENIWQSNFNIWQSNFNKVSRKYELNRLKALGLKYVVIDDCGDERDCKAVKHCKKRWPIDEVPELPLPGCDAEYCRCMYVADESDLLNL